MGGRESPGRPGCHRHPTRVWDQMWRTWRSRPRWRWRESQGWIPGPGKARVAEGSHRSCSVVILFSETALEEPFTASEGG